MKKLSRRIVMGAAFLFCSGLLTVQAAEPTASSARGALAAFLKNTGSAAGRFTQSSFDRAGKPTAPESSGFFRFLRPGRFEWMYEKPYEQQIMSNGKTLWLYDRDLMQVTVKALDASLPTTPAAILFGENALDDDWTLREIGAGELEAVPKSSGAGFESVRLRFDAKGELAGMTLVDSFGQTTLLTFSDLRREAQTDASFEFKVPEGADVLTDQSAF